MKIKSGVVNKIKIKKCSGMCVYVVCVCACVCGCLVSCVWMCVRCVGDMCVYVSVCVYVCLCAPSVCHVCMQVYDFSMLFC